MVLHYDADGAVTRREHIDAGGWSQSEWLVGPWRHDDRDGSTVESLGGIGYVEDGQRRWTLRGVGGQVEVVLDDGGAAITERELRAFGLSWAEQGADLDADSLHGLPFDEPSGLQFAGLRAFRAEDGQWLQPEPLLLNGMVGLDLADPQRGTPYRYGRDNPVTFADRDGQLTYDVSKDAWSFDAGDTSQSIATSVGATASDIDALNPALANGTIQPGDPLALPQLDNLLVFGRAAELIGAKNWAFTPARDAVEIRDFDANTNKCNQFVCEVAHSVGFDYPKIRKYFTNRGPRQANDFADPNVSMSEAVVTTSPVAGDVGAKSVINGSGHLWIHVGNINIVDAGGTLHRAGGSWAAVSPSELRVEFRDSAFMANDTAGRVVTYRRWADRRSGAGYGLP